jgi:hypothetical protein
MDTTTTEMLGGKLRDRRCGFSIGCLGALAEFQDPAAASVPDGGFMAVSDRGAIRVEHTAAASAIAYESLSGTADAWQCGIVFVTHANDGPGRARAVLTELTPDADAIRPCDRQSLLFDLGIGMPNVDYCVRTDDADLIAFLRRHAGMAVAQDGHRVLERIVDASPHRVALSALGRIEVYQRIDRHRTPHGPHTHLLPELLSKRRTHSANIPVPAGTLPLLTVHPDNPLTDAEGRRKPFARRAFDEFEALLTTHGTPEYVKEKRRLRQAVSAGRAPGDYRRPGTRLARLAMRIGLRQLLHAPPPGADVEPWIEAFGT